MTASAPVTSIAAGLEHATDRLETGPEVAALVLFRLSDTVSSIPGNDHFVDGVSGPVSRLWWGRASTLR